MGVRDETGHRVETGDYFYSHFVGHNLWQYLVAVVHGLESVMRKVQRLLRCLDDIGKLTKNGRSSRLARSTASFERTLPDSYQPTKKRA